MVNKLKQLLDHWLSQAREIEETIRQEPDLIKRAAMLAKFRILKSSVEEMMMESEQENPERFLR